MLTCGLCAVYTWQVPPRLCVFEYLARVLAQNEFCWRGLAVATESRALGAGFGALGLLFASSSSTDEARRVERYIVGPVCVECLIGKQKKPILFKVTEPSSCHDPSITVTGGPVRGGPSYDALSAPAG